MSEVVSCSRCGAPHRSGAGVTRFECDFCGATIQCDGAPPYEELVCPVPVDRRRCTEDLKRALLGRGLADATFSLGRIRWIAVWQAISSEGEEVLRMADRSESPLDARLGLPGLTLIDRHGSEVEDPENSPPRAALDAREAAAAARLCFAGADREASHLRLIWFRVIDVTVESVDFRQRGLYVVGADRVFLPEVFPTSPSGPIHGAVLLRFLAFTLVAFGLSITAPDLGSGAVRVFFWSVVTLGWEVFVISKPRAQS